MTRSVQVGEEVVVELPFSEVCMHLRVAGTRMRVRYLGQLQGVQLLNDTGAPFSAGTGWRRVRPPPPGRPQVRRA